MIGMVIFQGMLIVTGQFFPSSVEEYRTGTIDIDELKTNPDGEYDEQHGNKDGTRFSKTTNMGSIVVEMMFTPISLAIVGVFAGVGSGIGVVFGGVKNLPIALGVGIVTGLFVNIWNGTHPLISNLAANNEIVNMIFGIITVCIGILFVIMIGEFFLGQTIGVS
jgi:hypothetical protein